jgi:hypothetical protein
VPFPSFDFNIIVDVRCGVSVFYGRWFSTVFLAVPVLVPPKGSVTWSFFTSDFVCRATPSCAQVSVFPSHNFDLSSSAASVCRSRIIWACRRGVRAKVSVRSCRGSIRSSLGSARSLSDRAGALSCRGSIRSSLGSARSLSDCVGSLSDRHLAQPDLCPIVSGLCPIITWLSQTSVRSCRVSVRSSFGSAWSLSDHVGSLSDRHFALPLHSCGVSLA